MFSISMYRRAQLRIVCDMPIIKHIAMLTMRKWIPTPIRNELHLHWYTKPIMFSNWYRFSCCCYGDRSRWVHEWATCLQSICRVFQFGWKLHMHVQQGICWKWRCLPRSVFFFDFLES
jgi:hypothetical protein